MTEDPHTERVAEAGNQPCLLSPLAGHVRCDMSKLTRSEVVERLGTVVLVSVWDRQTRTTTRVAGRIARILTTTETHPHGIAVLLECGARGRVIA